MWTDESKGLHARPRADRGRLRQATAWSCSRIAVSLLLLALPALVQAQYTYTVAAGKVTITGYTGPGGAVTIPDLITGLPVTTIGDYAFYSALGPTSEASTSAATIASRNHRRERMCGRYVRWRAASIGARAGGGAAGTDRVSRARP